MRRLIYHLLVMAAASAGYAASSGPCVLPPSIQAKIHSHPIADNYAEAGLWFASRSKFACAAEAYQNAVKQKPKSADLLYLLGLNLIRNGDAGNAVKPLQESIELQPAALKSHLLLATALAQLGRAGDARSEWMAALKLDPRSEMALDGASKNFLAAREFDSVLALLGASPKGEALTLDLALAYRGSGKTDQAIDVLQKGLKAIPSSQVLTAELITNLFSQRRFSEAVKLAKGLVERSPRDLDSNILYLHVLVLNDEENLARPLAKKLLLTTPHNFTVLYLNGVLENRSGNYATARPFLEKAIELNPDHSESRHNLAISYSHLNNLQGAREQFEKALSLGASEPGVRLEYVKVLRSLGETDLAQEQFKVYEQEQKARADRTQAAIKMGQADEELKADPKKAAQLYRDALALLPAYALLHYKLSVALDRAGDIDGERDALQKAIEIDPRMAIAHRQLGYLSFNDGDFATAETHFRQAVEAAPTFADAWVSLAATLASEARPQEAVEAVKRALDIDPQNANAIELQKELANTAGQAHP